MAVGNQATTCFSGQNRMAMKNTGKIRTGTQKRKGPVPSSEEARKRMENQPQRDTHPEKKIRTILHQMGLRYRIDYRPIPGIRCKADFAFIRPKVAVFVDGCFWHGCPEHGTWPKANASFWRDKIETNRRRDDDTNRRLEENGWLPIRIWEHDDPEKAAKKIAKHIRTRKKTP